MKVLAVALTSIIAGCSAPTPVEMSCKAQFLYGRDGPDAAVLAFDGFSNKREYVVANNLALYLMLRGFKSEDSADFDHAFRILQSMDASEVKNIWGVRYIELLKFIASVNGSTPSSYRVPEECSHLESSAGCVAIIASEILNMDAATGGSKSQRHLDFLALYSHTHLEVFGSAFELQEDGWAIEQSACSLTGQEELGTEHTKIPEVRP